MNKYIKRIPDEPSFKQNGLYGYNFNLECEQISISVEDVFKGHDFYYTNTKSEIFYYVLEGNGTFCIDGEKIDVNKGEIIQIKQNTEYVFAGKMKLLLIMTPKHRHEDGIRGKENDLY